MSEAGYSDEVIRRYREMRRGMRSTAKSKSAVGLAWRRIWWFWPAGMKGR
jgi:hypothetical protein